ncbi:4'-phosphopantetheinyl transferase family protein [Paraburkholderia caledonica]|uniref:4'-phosphopantetheinyl transferase n=1 Tax=Paraburkholderia caledonica TaxID=134536 RepID=A0AB73IIG9_9BURK|nr:4'-phosphopantetheinyl transferase [Paraburkholderia caledonica]
MPYNLVVDSLSNRENCIPDDVHVFRVDFDFERSLNDSMFDVLSPEEHHRASKFLRHADAMRFASTRVALRRCLGAALGKDADALNFTQSAFGRPTLVDDDGLAHIDFNVSHSGNHGLVAWSTVRRIGVDIEVRNKQMPWNELVRMVFGEADILELQSTPLSRQGDLFFDIWVAKEALLKAHGTGITDGLKDFSVMSSGFSHLVRGSTTLAERLREFQGVWVSDILGHAAFVAWSRQRLGLELSKP